MFTPNTDRIDYFQSVYHVHQIYKYVEMVDYIAGNILIDKEIENICAKRHNNTYLR